MTCHGGEAERVQFLWCWGLLRIRILLFLLLPWSRLRPVGVRTNQGKNMRNNKNPWKTSSELKNMLHEKWSLTRAHALARREHLFSRQKPDEVSMGNHDTVEELGSLVQQAQQRAGAKSKRGSGNCAESRTQLFANAVEKFLRDKPSTMLHSEGTLSNHGQQPRAGICAQV